MATGEVLGRELNDGLLKKLKITLLFVKAVLSDAEERQIACAAVKKWVEELKDAIYVAEDILDGIATEALGSRVELEAESQGPFITQAKKFISFRSNPIPRRIESKKIENIINRLECLANKKDTLGLKEGEYMANLRDILGLKEGSEDMTNLKDILSLKEDMANQKDILGLKEVSEGKPYRKLPSTSSVEESDIYGRDDDKEAILKLLLEDDECGSEISVVPIVGMGGIGKTTLAQLLYNDGRVKAHFDMHAWVCVSEEFDVFRVTKTIYEAVTSLTDDVNDFNLLQVKLKRSLTGKQFLLVLDDVWNENYVDWEVLGSPLKAGARGSKIIVTTRNGRVASIMGTTPIYHLKHLLDEDCWLLFAKQAFDDRNFSTYPKLEVIGREIVKKCKGLPLAAKTLGGLLFSKVEPKEWEKIFKSDIWDLSNAESNILPALRLSYMYLPSHLKRCFAYCSLFPKDYEFAKEQLVMLWMAEGFLPHQKNNERVEEIGDEYFDDLVSRSFFQRSSRDNLLFVMHDLVNDLAKYVSGEFCFRLDDDNSNEISEKTRHASYIKTRYDVTAKFDAFYKAKCLRTFLPLKFPSAEHFLSEKVICDLLPSLRCLRVLSLAHYSNITELPDSIGDLKQLRYLNLAHTKIKKLPDSTTTLYNLQTLLLSNCHYLTKLPTNMGRLINMRHLNLTGTNLKEMPLHMSRLENLQTLTLFVLSKGSGSSIKELRGLRYLRGTLSILQLQNVVCAWDGLEANLKDKKFLEELLLEWDTNTDDTQNESDVLVNIQPHTNLERLSIKNYGGTKFPDWLGNPLFSNMVFLCLNSCKYCFLLPPLGQLTSLRELVIIGFDGLVKVGPEFFGDGVSSVKPFRSLEVLRFEEMLEWQEWICSEGEDENGSFPCLRKLCIENCPKLTRRLPNHLPCLTELVIVDCQQLMASLPRAAALSQLDLINCNKLLLKELPLGLHWLTVTGFHAIESLPLEIICSNTCLEELDISDCSALRFLLKGSLPGTLKNLGISNCGRLELLMQDYYTYLESLSIFCSCDSLRYFQLEFFPKLSRLHVEGCRNLEIVSLQQGLNLASLNFLQISGCHNFISFPIGGLPAPNLTWFWVENCEKLKFLPEKMHTLLPSLQVLYMGNCPELDSFPEGGLPSNLYSLSISHCEKLMAGRREWNLVRVSSLREFSIRSNCEVESFPEEGLLPTSLTSFYILGISNLKSLEYMGIQHLTSLEELKIWDCPKFQSMPEEGLPSSLSSLRIHNCPLLRQCCQKEKGIYWSKVSHIPCIQIDDEVIIQDEVFTYPGFCNIPISHQGEGLASIFCLLSSRVETFFPILEPPCEE